MPKRNISKEPFYFKATNTGAAPSHGFQSQISRQVYTLINNSQTVKWHANCRYLIWKTDALTWSSSAKASLTSSSIPTFSISCSPSSTGDRRSIELSKRVLICRMVAALGVLPWIDKPIYNPTKLLGVPTSQATVPKGYPIHVLKVFSTGDRYIWPIDNCTASKSGYITDFHTRNSIVSGSTCDGKDTTG